MLQNNAQSDPVLQADILALDALFKRIAERGRKIRVQNSSTDSEGSAKDVLSEGEVPNTQDKGSKN